MKRLVLLVIFFPLACYATNNKLEYDAVTQIIDFKIEAIYGLRIIVAFILGAIIGFTHNRQYQSVDFKVFTAVALGSCIVGTISMHLFFAYNVPYAFMILAGTVTGVGFLGAALIHKKDGMITGLSSAAILWATSTIGLAIGVGMYLIAFICILLIVIFNLFLNPEKSSRL